MTIQSINPATGQVINTYEEMSVTQADSIIEATHRAFNLWKETSFSDRAKKLLQLAVLLEKNKTEYANLITSEMGKPLSSSVAEIEKCQKACRYFAENAEKFLSPQPVATEKSKSYIVYKPLGTIFAIMPWNFPFWQIFRFITPNFMAGNAVLLRHAPICTGTGIAIEKLIQDAGFPTDLLRTLVIDNRTAAHVIHHPLVKGVTLTGSPRAGSIVGSAAAASLKKVVLELGGNDPYIVLEDADLKKAAAICVASRLNNSGQVCIAAKRIIVVDSVREAFEQFVLDELKKYRMGDPTSPETNLGPLARADLRENVHRQVQECIQQGATLITGGKIPDRPGFYYPPTVLKNIKIDMPVMREEIFGPVIALISAKDEQDAIRIANDSEYGLSAAIFTQNIERGEAIAANHIHAGSCFVNDLVSSDPRLPFGGINHSGFGRELGEAGIREFVNIKTVCVK